MMKKITITGQRGSWFAKAGDERLPIMWANDVTGKTLLTDWLENTRVHSASKRSGLVDYFLEYLGNNTRIIIAQAVDTSVIPRTIKHYVAVFEVKVINVEPEIELEIIERIGNAR